MPVFAANIVPVNARFTFDNDASTFRLRISTQIKRPDGTRYEVEVETNADLGILAQLLFDTWVNGHGIDTPVTAMALPSAVVVPTADDATFAGIIDTGVAGDVGTADPADDLVDSDLV